MNAKEYFDKQNFDAAEQLFEDCNTLIKVNHKGERLSEDVAAAHAAAVAAIYALHDSITACHTKK